MIRAAASLTGLTVVFGLVLYLTLGDGDSSPSTTATPSPIVEHPTPTATPVPVVATSPTATPLPVAIRALLEDTPITAMVQGPSIDLPDDLAFLITTGCWGCDGPPSGITRVSRNAEGEIATEVLFSPDLLDLPQEAPAHITSLDSSDDASRIVVAVCTAGFCGGLGYPGPDAETTLFSSTDGGVTWMEAAVLDGAHYIVGLNADDVIMTGPLPMNGDAPPAPFYYLSNGVEITPPDAGVEPGYWPIMTPEGGLLWTNAHGTLVTSTGEHFFSQPSESDLILVSDGVWGLNWFWGNAKDDSGAHDFLTYLDPEGNIIRSFDSRQNVQYGPAADGYHYGNADIDSGLFDDEPAGFGFTYLPVRIDFKGGVFHPILHPFTDEGLVGGRNGVLAVQTGPFARIDDTRSCLNLRTSPGLDATKVACLADGVLLRHDSYVVTNQDIDWLQVTAPDGTQGWAATEFLEY